ncbi:hypothetical protein GF312_18480 [Candidatus Poribacteria bacterium]|nr:hypothetical protein [Candidatus Poribacteria bacterium]
MKIAVRKGKDSEWRRIPDSETQQDESSVRDLIYQIPELLSIDGSDDGEANIKICIKAPSANGSEDSTGLIGVDDKGGISIIECKMPKDSSTRREIMGRVLEYGAVLWEMSYEEFDAIFLENQGKHLQEIMEEKVDSESWDPEDFVKNLNTTLGRGNFRLIITINRLNNELRRTIKFLNARGPFSFETYALEIRNYSDEGIDIVVPRLIVFDLKQSAKNKYRSFSNKENQRYAVVEELGERSNEPTIAQPAKPLEKDEEKEELFFNKCKENLSENAVKQIKQLYQLSVETADDIIWWGSGGAGAFNFILTGDGLTVFIVDANGKIMFNFSEWQEEQVYQEILPRFLEKLRGIKILQQQKEDYTRWPDFSVEEFLADESDFKAFEEAIRFLRDELHSQ